MRAVGRLVQELCEETRAGRSWMLPLAREESPAWMAFHGAHGGRGESTPVPAGPSRIDLWPRGGDSLPVLTVSVAANQDFRGNALRLIQRPVDPHDGWLLLLALVHALDEASRARPRVPAVGDILTSAGTPTLGAWASALTLADLQSALLQAHR